MFVLPARSAAPVTNRRKFAETTGWNSLASCLLIVTLWRAALCCPTSPQTLLTPCESSRQYKESLLAYLVEKCVDMRAFTVCRTSSLSRLCPHSNPQFTNQMTLCFVWQRLALIPRSAQRRTENWVGFTESSEPSLSQPIAPSCF